MHLTRTALAVATLAATLSADFHAVAATTRTPAATKVYIDKLDGDHYAT